LHKQPTSPFCTVSKDGSVRYPPGMRSVNRDSLTSGDVGGGVTDSASCAHPRDFAKS